MEKQTCTSDDITASPMRRGQKPGGNATGDTVAQPVTPVPNERSQGAAKRTKKADGTAREARKNRINDYFGMTTPPKKGAAEESKEEEKNKGRG